MIRLAVQLPKETVVAVSGGPDSMGLLEFLLRTDRRVVGVVHVKYHEGESRGRSKSSSPYRIAARVLVEEYCRSKNIPLRVVEAEFSSEADASEERLRVFTSSAIKEGCPVAVGHNLYDAWEWFLRKRLSTASSVEGALMHPISQQNPAVYRPFLLATREQILGLSKGVPSMMDPTNIGPSNMRARMREMRVRESLDYALPEAWGFFRNSMLQLVESRKWEV